MCPDWWRNYGAEQYGPDSVCLYQKSAFVMEQCTRKMTYPDWGSGCYKVRLVLCVPDVSCSQVCVPGPQTFSTFSRWLALLRG